MGRLKKAKPISDWDQKIQELFTSVQNAPDSARQKLIDSIQGKINQLNGPSMEAEGAEIASTSSRPVRKKKPSVRLRELDTFSDSKEPDADHEVLEITSSVNTTKDTNESDVVEMGSLSPKEKSMRRLIIKTEEGENSDIVVVVEEEPVIVEDSELREVQVQEVQDVKEESNSLVKEEGVRESSDAVEEVVESIEAVQEARESIDVVQEARKSTDTVEESMESIEVTEETRESSEELMEAELEEKMGGDDSKPAEQITMTDVWAKGQKGATVKDEEAGKNQKAKKYKGRQSLRQCDECGKKVKDLIKHRMYHSKETLPIIQCPDCNYQSKYKENMYRHRQLKHSTERPFKCSLCQAAFVNPQKLRTHIHLEHEGGREKRFHCDHCSFMTHTESILKRHIFNKHSEDKPTYTCEICGLKLSYKDTYEVHMRRHTGQQPYQCPNCNKSFKSGSNLNQHMKTHEARRFLCQVCKKSFFTKSHLLRHFEALHTNTKSHECPFCIFVCNNPYNLRKHCITMHDKIYPPHCRKDWRCKVQGAKDQESDLQVKDRVFDLHIDYVIDENGQRVQYSEATQDSNVIYIDPKGDGKDIKTIDINDLQNAEVLKKEHIPVSNEVWESLQSAVASGQDIPLEEILKSTNVAVPGAAIIKSEKEDDNVTYYVIESQEADVSEEAVTEETVVTDPQSWTIMATKRGQNSQATNNS